MRRSPRRPAGRGGEAEALGLGSAFISERYNIKEAATLWERPARCRSRIGIATAATNHNTRHPLVTASYATTMHRLTGGRFTLGLGRGIDAMFGAYGIPRITTAQMEDFAGLMRRLWKGEVIFGHDGPAGRFPILHLDATFDEDIPLGLVAFGPNTLALGRPGLRHGRAAHVLHRRDARALRRDGAAAAEQAGRDPASVRVWSCFATVGDHCPRTSGSRRPSVAWPPTSRATAT